MTPDQPISVAVAVAGVLLSIALPRRFAIVPLALSISLYPSSLLLPPQNLSFTAQRLIALILLLRCFIQPSIRSRFRWRLADTAAAAYFLLGTLAMSVSFPDTAAVINNRLGFFLNALVPFWCVRFLIVDRPSLYALLKGWLWGAVPMALGAIYQMNTGDSPYFRIMPYGIIWTGAMNNWWDMRYLLGRAFYRASAPFALSIMFGWFFAALIAPCTNLFFQKRRFWPWGIAFLALPVGVASSIAMGAFGVAGMSVGLLGLFPWRRYWKIAAFTLACVYLMLLVGANRSPMEFVASLGKNESSSWYRVKLEDYTLYGGGMSGHWFTGYGEIPLQYAFNGMHDLCIHWVWLLVTQGLMGLVGFYGLMAACAASLWKGKRVAVTQQDQWLLWSLMSLMLAAFLGMRLVALFSEMYFIFHMLLALVANADLLVGRQTARQATVLARSGGRPVVLRFALQPGQALALIRPVKPEA